MAWSLEDPSRWQLVDLSDYRPRRGRGARGAGDRMALHVPGHRPGDTRLQLSRSTTRQGRGMSTDRTQTGGIRGMRRTQVATTRLIDTAFLPGEEERTPLIVTPAVENVDLAEWCAANKDELNGYLDRTAPSSSRASASRAPPISSGPRPQCRRSCSPSTATCRRSPRRSGSTTRPRIRPTRPSCSTTRARTCRNGRCVSSSSASSRPPTADRRRSSTAGVSTRRSIPSSGTSSPRRG